MRPPVKRFTISESDIKRFFKWVKKTDNCWNWIGKPLRGYGRIQLFNNGKPTAVLAHRFSFQLHKGETKLLVLHSCNNTLCVNPEHLRPGTDLENKLDSVKQNRHKWPNPMFKENNPGSKITQEIADKIREISKTKITHAAIGKIFGLSQTHVSAIIRGEYWRVK